ncbi:hypothetical protein LUZ60_006144 [Juncus effusus]|nr:hypothetical protein LUZ60_006144 [Juncus effusus]
MSGAAETRSNSGGGGAAARSLSLPKEGERIIAPSRRPDGTYRKEIRIRAGYVPQDEVAIYQSKGALLKKGQPEFPPGLNPELLIKPKTKSAKRNEKKKEKRQQAALASEKGKDLESSSSVNDEVAEADWTPPVESVTDQMTRVGLSDSNSSSTTQDSSGQDLDKKIRAIKKKIRLGEAQLQGDPQNMKPEQLEKMKKMEGWREELKILEEKKAIM